MKEVEYEQDVYSPKKHYLLRVYLVHDIKNSHYTVQVLRMPGYTLVHSKAKIKTKTDVNKKISSNIKDIEKGRFDALSNRIRINKNFK